MLNVDITALCKGAMTRVGAVLLIMFSVGLVAAIGQEEGEDADFDYLAPELGLFSQFKRFGERLFIQPVHPRSYTEAKRLMYSRVGDSETLYCGCPLNLELREFNADACGYVPKNDNIRAKRVEAEHILPAFWIDKFHDGPSCWVKSDSCGSARECCLKNDVRFRDAHNDLVNLYPSIGELNGDRSNLLYDLVVGEPREYGKCDFEVSTGLKITEPKEDVRGDIARVYFYMERTYELSFPEEMVTSLKEWDVSDPLSDSEIARNERIRNIQGHANNSVSE